MQKIYLSSAAALGPSVRAYLRAARGQAVKICSIGASYSPGKHMRNSKKLSTSLLSFTLAAYFMPFMPAGLAVERSQAKPAIKPVAKAVAKPAEAAANETPAAPAVSLVAPNLVPLANDYRSNPDELSWSRYATYLRDLLALPQYVVADAAHILAANPSFGEFKVKVSETGTSHFRVWSFPSIRESHSVIFQTPARTTAIPLPQSVSFREAHIVGAASSSPAKLVVTKKGKAVVSKVVHPAVSGSGPKSLVLIGADRATAALWFKGFQLVEGMPEAPELFSALPAFFTQNVTGKAAFSGNDIVLTIQPPAPAKVEKREEDKIPGVVKDTISKPVAAATTAGYKVVLKFIGGKYTLAGHATDDAPQSIALSFCQAVANSRPDIAKSWLVDGKLISIPKYLGLFGKVSPPMRLVAMSSQGGAARYRLVTSAKNDLIVEVGRITQPGPRRGQLAVKALFVAPSDAIAKNLSGTMVLPGSAATSSTSSSAATSDKPAPSSTAVRKN